MVTGVCWCKLKDEKVRVLGLGTQANFVSYPLLFYVADFFHPDITLLFQLSYCYPFSNYQLYTLRADLII